MSLQLCFNFVCLYRCKIPECDSDENNRLLQYDQTWLSMAIPSSNSTFDSCFRYAPVNSSEFSAGDRIGQCSDEMFDTSKKIACTEFVYTSDEKNVQTEVR